MENREIQAQVAGIGEKYARMTAELMAGLDPVAKALVAKIMFDGMLYVLVNERGLDAVAGLLERAAGDLRKQQALERLETLN
jgi:hypothetical protein